MGRVRRGGGQGGGSQDLYSHKGDLTPETHFLTLCDKEEKGSGGECANAEELGEKRNSSKKKEEKKGLTESNWEGSRPSIITALFLRKKAVSEMRENSTRKRKGGTGCALLGRKAI